MSISESGNLNAGPGEQILFASGSDAVVIDSASLLFGAESVSYTHLTLPTIYSV